MKNKFLKLFHSDTNFNELTNNNYLVFPYHDNTAQNQTTGAFTNKWNLHDYKSDDFRNMVERQKNRYLKLYGFANEKELATFLQKFKFIYDAGSGMGYKAAWFADLSPETLVVAADISDAVIRAANQYKHYDNLLFIQCDIAKTDFFKDNCFDYVSCDQVIHHTTVPYKTFQELFRVTKPNRELSVYVYRKKALPRELLDDYFRDYSMNLSHEQLLELSEQLTALGRILSTIDEEFDFPDIPLLDIQGGKSSVQRFIYGRIPIFTVNKVVILKSINFIKYQSVK